MHMSRGFNVAVMHSCSEGKISMRPWCGPTQGQELQQGPSALVCKGHEFNEAPVCSRKAPWILIWP